MANENKMTIIEALIQLRDDIKSWVINNFQNVFKKINQHTDDKENPHVVTKEQIGLGSLTETEDGIFTVADENGNIAFQVSEDGTTKAAALNVIGNYPLSISRDGSGYAHFMPPEITGTINYYLPVTSGKVLLEETVAGATLSSATTTNKTIVGAINELNSKNLPTCTTANNGQFLMVVGGVPTWTTIPNAEDATF